MFVNGMMFHLHASSSFSPISFFFSDSWIPPPLLSYGFLIFELVLFTAGDKILLKSASNVLVMVKPVGSLPGSCSQAEIGDSIQLKTIYSDVDPEKEEEETRIRVGINGMLHLVFL